MRHYICLFTFCLLIGSSDSSSAACDTWEPDSHYTINDKVLYNGQGYECTVYDVWFWPPTDTRYWVTTNECDAPPEKCDLQIQLNDYGAVEVNATPEGEIETYDNSELRSILFEYDCGTSVTLTALPFEGCDFKHWIINGAQITSNPYTLTVNDPQDATVADPIFELIPPPQYTLTVNTSGDGVGSVTILPLKATYDEGENVTLIAEPEKMCDEFVCWLGQPVDSSISNIAYITITQNTSLTAQFTDNGTCVPAADYEFPANVADENTKMRVGDVSRFESTVLLNDSINPNTSYWANLSGIGFTFGKRVGSFSTMYTKMGSFYFDMHDPLSGGYTKITPSNIIARKEVSDSESVTEIDGGFIQCDDSLICRGTIRGNKLLSEYTNSIGWWRILSIKDGELITETSSGHSIRMMGSSIIINNGATQLFSNGLITENIDARGQLKTRKVIVTNQGWADNVFSKDYKLPSLEEIEKHIKENGHLPGIPSEQSVTENGLDVGEMQAKLLAQIEEMTLRMIQMKKEMTQMQEKIAALEKAE